MKAAMKTAGVCCGPVSIDELTIKTYWYIPLVARSVAASGVSATTVHSYEGSVYSVYCSINGKSGVEFTEGR